jgi:hypothetical protein
MTVAAILRQLELCGIELRLVGDRVRWRGDAPSDLLALATKHRDDIRRYLARRCEGCGRARPVMVLMDEHETPWWQCARCYCGMDSRLHAAQPAARHREAP